MLIANGRDIDSGFTKTVGLDICRRILPIHHATAKVTFQDVPDGGFVISYQRTRNNSFWCAFINRNGCPMEIPRARVIELVRSLPMVYNRWLLEPDLGFILPTIVDRNGQLSQIEKDVRSVFQGLSDLRLLNAIISRAQSHKHPHTLQYDWDWALNYEAFLDTPTKTNSRTIVWRRDGSTQIVDWVDERLLDPTRADAITRIAYVSLLTDGGISWSLFSAESSMPLKFNMDQFMV